MKFPKGFPFYDPPWRQPITRKEQGHWFAPKPDVDLETTEAELKVRNERSARIKKILKIVLILLGVAVFLLLGYHFYKDNIGVDFSKFKNLLDLL